MFTGEQASRSPECREHLIEDEKHVVRVTPRAKGLERTVWPEANPRCALHERLDDDGGKLVGVEG